MSKIQFNFRRDSDPVLVAYILARVVARGECWEWIGELDHDYGRINYNKENYLANSVIWRLIHGFEPNGFMLHRCDNPPCVRPTHIFPGTKGDNNRDSMLKGRRCKKLTPAKVIDIRTTYSNGGTSYGALAKKYQVSKALIRDVVKHRQWRWING